MILKGSVCFLLLNVAIMTADASQPILGVETASARTVVTASNLRPEHAGHIRDMELKRLKELLSVHLVDKRITRPFS